MEAYITGLTLGASLIIAIGAQNAYVLTQGIRRRYHLVIPLVCSLSDGILITTGVLGVGELLRSRPLLAAAGSAGGAIFLLWYGLLRFRSFFSGGRLEKGEGGPENRIRAIGITLAVTWLNPHVYIDTVLLMGGISSGFSGPDKTGFASGAITASVLWFFTLSLGGRRLSPLFRNSLSWRILDLTVGIIMWAIAAGLIADLAGLYLS